jgi:hypothetical protein
LSPSQSASPSASQSPSSSPSISPSASTSPSSSNSPSPSQEISNFTRQAISSLPTDEHNLDNAYTEQEEILIQKRNRITVDQSAMQEYMVHQFKQFVGRNTSCEITIDISSTLATSDSKIQLEIFNYNTNLWEMVDKNDWDQREDTPLELVATIRNVTKYKNPYGSITCRVWQLAK